MELFIVHTYQQLFQQIQVHKKIFILGVYKEKNIYYIYVCKNEKHKKVFIYNIKGKNYVALLFIFMVISSELDVRLFHVLYGVSRLVGFYYKTLLSRSAICGFSFLLIVQSLEANAV